MAGDPPIGKVDLHLSCHQRTDTPDQDLSFTSSWYQLLDHLQSHLPSMQGTVPPYPTVHGISFGKAWTQKVPAFWVGGYVMGSLEGNKTISWSPPPKCESWTAGPSPIHALPSVGNSSVVLLSATWWWWDDDDQYHAPLRDRHEKNVHRCRYMCYKWHLSFVYDGDYSLYICYCVWMVTDGSPYAHRPSTYIL